MKGKVALLVGATSGIGREAAEEFARRGAAVVISGRREELGEQVVEGIRASGGEAAFVRADVSSESDVENMVRRTVELYGGLDYAFNNAGDSPRSGTRMHHEYDSADFLNIINVHLTGIYYAMRYELAQMVVQGRGGSIVNMSSIFGVRGDIISGPAYPAAKHGAIGLTRSGAVQYASHNIRVNVVCPGVIDTDRDRGTAAAELTGAAERLVRWHPLGRFGHADEVAKAVVWLCSDDASFITGAVLPIDGGNSAQM